jgi:anti-anti-sigma regulatory factor
MNLGSRRNTVRPLVAPEIVRLPHEIDLANADYVGDELRPALSPGVAAVIADVTHTVLCDSVSIRYLLVAHDLAVANHARLRLAVSSSALLRVLQVTGADQARQIRVRRLHNAHRWRPRGIGAAVVITRSTSDAAAAWLQSRRHGERTPAARSVAAPARPTTTRGSQSRGRQDQDD